MSNSTNQLNQRISNLYGLMGSGGGGGSQNLDQVLAIGDTATNDIILNNLPSGTNTIKLLPNFSFTNPHIELTDGIVGGITNTINKNGYTTRNSDSQTGIHFLNFVDLSNNSVGAIQKTKNITCYPNSGRISLVSDAGTGDITLQPDATPDNPTIVLTDGTATNTITKTGISGNAATATAVTTLTSDESDQPCFIPFQKSVGSNPLFCDNAAPTPFTFNPFTSTLTASNFSAAGAGAPISGGNQTITTGGYIYQIFTSSSGTLVVSGATTIDFIMVGGGGGGGTSHAGGGGAGGVIAVSGASIGVGNYNISIGTGGTAGTSTTIGGNGGNTTFAFSGGLTAGGGGGGGTGAGLLAVRTGAAGLASNGNGGGGSAVTGTDANGGAGANPNPTPPPNGGFNGAKGVYASVGTNGAGGGGGGAGAVGISPASGQTAPTATTGGVTAGAGGAGIGGIAGINAAALVYTFVNAVSSTINSVITGWSAATTGGFLAGGGGGGSWGGAVAPGGTGGGGNGGTNNVPNSGTSVASIAGFTNTGGGGGAGGSGAGTGSSGSAGGTGILIVRASTSGTITSNLTYNSLNFPLGTTINLNFRGLPTSAPATSGSVWRNGNVLNIVP